MNPQYITPGQPPLQQPQFNNNNIPPQVASYPQSTMNSSNQNANIYQQSQGFDNGPNSQPPKSGFGDQGQEVSQKLQDLQLGQQNGPYSNGPPTSIPQGQLPPGMRPPISQLPPTSNFPPASNFAPTSNFPPTAQVLSGPPQVPPTQRPPNFSTPPISRPQGEDTPGLPQMPPTSVSAVNSPRPPTGVPPRSSQSPLPAHSAEDFNQIPNVSSQSQQLPGAPPSSIAQQFRHDSPQSILPPHSQHGQLPQPSQSSQFSLNSQPGQMPPHSQPGELLPNSQPQLTSQVQQGPPKQGQIPQQSNHLNQQPFGQPPLSGQQSSQPGGQLPPQPGQLPPQPGQLPPQTGHLPLQPGQLPPQPGQSAPQAGQSPPQPGQMPSQVGQPQAGQFPPQHSQSGHLPPPGQLPQQRGQLPPQPSQLQPQPAQYQPQGPFRIHPPIPGQQLGPQQPHSVFQPGPQQFQTGPQQLPSGHQQPGAKVLPHQQPSLPGMPHMPPMAGQQQNANRSYPGMPPMPGQQPQNLGQQPPMPGQQPMMPGQQRMLPGQQPMMPGQQPIMSGQSPMIPGQQQMIPGQQPMMPGQQPMTPGQQRMMPGQPPMSPGQQPIMPGQQPMMPGQQPIPGQQQMMPGQQQYQQPGYTPNPQQQGYAPNSYQQQPYPGQQHFQGQPPFPAQQAPKRLDPDQMPSPIQVMLDDQNSRGGIFVTNDKGLVPPLVTTTFVVDDQGNSSPRYIRSSMYSIPPTQDMMKQMAVPFCLVISPLAELETSEREPPLLDFAAMTGNPAAVPVRCARCKAYISTAMKFVDAGRHFKCAFCKATTEVPMEYTQYINSMQQYGQMPAEMAIGTYEIVATKEYCKNNTLPNPPALIFLIDVSYNSIRTGLLQLICANIQQILEAIPKDENTGKQNTRVGFITYSSTIHFYNIKGTLAQPQMLLVGDVSEVFVPLLDGFLVTPEESGQVLDSLAQQLPRMFADNRETETILLPAVQAGLEALKAADTSGQLLVFHTSLPTGIAPGKLANRDDRKLLGTEKEKQILAPQTTAYNELGQQCSGAGCCVELFLANNSYIDVATIGQLARLTGGGINKYTYFQAENDGDRFLTDICRVVSRPTAYDAVMRVRTSTGVRATDFFGHFFMSNTTDIEFGAIDADKAIAVEIKHDDKLTGEDGVYIQAALLYTHRSGQRRLRVINLALNVADQMADVFRSCDLDTTMNFLCKQAIWNLREGTPRAIRDALISRCARALATYRRHCASPSSAGQLVLPESMKLMPLYVACVLREDSIGGGPDITCDDRSCAMHRMLTADVGSSVVALYPRLVPVHHMLPLLRDGAVSPQQMLPLRCSIDKMRDDGVYLLENGTHMLLWVGSQADPEFCKSVLDVPSAQHLDTAVRELPELDNTLSAAVRGLIEDARNKRRRCMRLTIMRQHDKLETVLRHFLVEDRGVDGSDSYVDFLCHVHKEIRALL